jgi:hypothetical protein
MDDIKGILMSERSGETALSELSIEMTESANGEPRQSIGHQLSDPVTPYIHESIGDEM